MDLHPWILQDDLEALLHCLTRSFSAGIQEIGRFTYTSDNASTVFMARPAPLTRVPMFPSPASLMYTIPSFSAF